MINSSSSCYLAVYWLLMTCGLLCVWTVSEPCRRGAAAHSSAPLQTATSVSSVLLIQTRPLVCRSVQKRPGTCAGPSSHGQRGSSGTSGPTHQPSPYQFCLEVTRQRHPAGRCQTRPTWDRHTLMWSSRNNHTVPCLQGAKTHQHRIKHTWRDQVKGLVTLYWAQSQLVKVA